VRARRKRTRYASAVRTRRRSAGFSALGASLAAAAAAQEEPPFDVLELPAPGRTAAAGFADLDGDGRSDLFSVALSGVPPRDRRELRVHFQTPAGALPAAPDWTGEVLSGAAAFDLADLPDGPGEELLLLGPQGVSVLSFAGRSLARRELALPGAPSAATAPDERGLDRLRLARAEFGDGLLLLVPGLGTCAVLRPDGTLLGELAVGHRANYFVPPRPGPLVGENELEQFYDFPRLDVGDADGDGRADVIASNRHEVRVFARRPDGGFDAEPTLRLALDRLSEKDMIRSASANVRVASADFDGDGRADLLVSHTSGGFLDARSETTLHLNRAGTWNLAEPDQRFAASERWNAWILVDLDGDGRVELGEAQVPLSILELIELLVTRSLDVEVLFRRSLAGGVYEQEPWLRRKLSLALSFDTFEPLGFVPTLDADLNGDGRRDALGSGGGRALEVMLGDGDSPWGRVAARQELDTTGSLRFGDLDRDGLSDLLIYDRTRPGTPIRIARNRGVLPGTHPRLELRAPDAPDGAGFE
jgi:hypothetical protein